MEEHIHFGPMGINTACNCENANIINSEKVKKRKISIMDNRLSDIKDSERYRWLRLKFSMGEESYIGEWISSEDELDKYIDEQIIKEQQKELMGKPSFVME